MTKLRLRSKVNFPANVTADGGIAVRHANELRAKLHGEFANTGVAA